MLFWVEIGLLVVLLPIAAWQGVKALRSVIVKMKEEEGFH